MTGKALSLVAVVAFALAPTAAGTGGKPTFHDHGTDSGVDTNFCGTGATIEYEGRFNAVGWESGSGEFKATFNYRFTLTNPENGATIVDSAAGSFTDAIVAGSAGAAHTHLFVETGLRAKLQLEGGGVLTRDAGVISYTISVDADGNFAGFTLEYVHGPHPAFFDSDVWCDTATEALGIG